MVQHLHQPLFVPNQLNVLQFSLRLMRQFFLNLDQVLVATGQCLVRNQIQKQSEQEIHYVYVNLKITLLYRLVPKLQIISLLDQILRHILTMNLRRHYLLLLWIEYWSVLLKISKQSMPLFYRRSTY